MGTRPVKAANVANPTKNERLRDAFLSRIKPCMTVTTEEILRVCEALPSDKQAEVADFARFLLEKQNDQAWDERLGYPKSRPRLDAFLRESATEGDEPLDPNRL